MLSVNVATTKKQFEVALHVAKKQFDIPSHVAISDLCPPLMRLDFLRRGTSDGGKGGEPHPMEG
jgi:hypothetical protein